MNKIDKIDKINKIKDKLNYLKKHDILYNLDLVINKYFYLINDDIIDELYKYYNIDKNKNSGLKLLINGIKHKIKNDPNNYSTLLDNPDLNNLDENYLNKICEYIDNYNLYLFDEHIMYLKPNKNEFINNFIKITYINNKDFISQMKDLLNIDILKDIKNFICNSSEIKRTLFYYCIYGLLLENKKIN